MLVLLLVLLCTPHRVYAGGSGLNVIVVVNPNSPDSLALGNYYCERRQVPPQNVIRLNSWAGGRISWTRGQMQQALFEPLLAGLALRGLSGQIDYILLSMDIPYEVIELDSLNSTTSVLFYGFKPDVAPAGGDSCSLPYFSSNSYAFSEAIFRGSPPDTGPATPFLAMMLTASNLDLAKLTVDQAVAGDHTFPTAAAYLARTYDGTRSVRAQLFEDAIFDCQVQGDLLLVQTNQNSAYGLSGLLGYQTGLAQFSFTPNTFVPGAIADSLTSFGGALFENTGQTTLLAFLAAGATGSYGTVIEPCALIPKFPSPRDYFYQARGFSLAESYYQSLMSPYQGLLVGEPLAAPFSRQASGLWLNLPPGALLQGVTNLSLQFRASDPGRPLAQVDLFVDGLLQQTLTNIPPAEGDVLRVTLNGHTSNYRVPSQGTLGSVTAGLADVINTESTLSRVAASPVGDRITLRSTDPLVSGSQVAATAGSSGTRPTTFATLSRGDFLDSTSLALGTFEVPSADVAPGDTLTLEVTKASGEIARVSVTNLVAADSPIPLARSLADKVNLSPVLQASDGAMATVVPSSILTNACTFKLQARAPGLAGSVIQANLRSFPGGWLSPTTNHLDANLDQTEPRNHIYVTAGVTNLALTFPFDTTKVSDGYHELTAVAYEGSHVQTQTHISVSVLVSNTPLVATLTALVGDSNSAVEATLVLLAEVNTNNVASIELFSTGGSLGVTNGQSSATFDVPGNYLGVGSHPFYAMITTTSGAQYRTPTKWIRLVGGEAPFRLQVAGSPPTLSWPSVAGRRYDVLSSDGLGDPFQLRQTVFPTNGLGQWSETDTPDQARFYRVLANW